ncbi:protein neuralized-like [Tribolium madens]|uniref:protein neuralized-like n=1 Tax=Tribolium madens TaxID=41895 RepID=UPI001CF742CB|nr:protein neuralized-like [Tribolium madens]XP_044267946.1 protein neuralized-like [Tribolium madens]
MGQGQSSTKPVFHLNHGEDTELCEENSVAVRVENSTKSWSKGLVFSAQPVKTNQKVYVELIVVSGASHDVLSFGFTSQDPTGTADEGNSWTGSLSKYFCTEGAVFYFYVSNSGAIHFGKLDGSERKILSKKVETSRSIWAVIYIWNEPTTVRLLSQREARLVKFSGRNEEKRCVEVGGKKIMKEVGVDTDSEREDYRLCIICCGSGRDSVFVPCGHMCTCFRCGLMVQDSDNLCPICRKRIGSIVRVYKS